MDMLVIISQMAVLFILLAVGYVSGKVNVLTQDGSKSLSKVVLYITTPGLILSSVAGGEIHVTGGETTYFVLMSFLAFLIYFLIAIPLAHALGGDKKNHGLFSYMASFSNAAFMGFPVTIAIFGTESAFFVALFNIPFFILNFSAGIIMVSGRGREFDPKLLVNPSLIAALIAIPIAISGFRAPYVVAETFRIAGSVTTPGAMLVIGSTLARVPIRDVFSKWRLFPVATMKLAVMPLAIWLILRNVVTNELMLGILVVLSGMPTAASAAMLAIEYNGDERIASSGIFLSTLLSGMTIPLIVYFLLT